MVVNKCNGQAVIGLPIYLIISIIVAAVLFSLVLRAILQYEENMQIEKLNQAVTRIVSEAETMYEYADEVSKITLHIEFPIIVDYIVFGALPQLNYTRPINLTLSETSDNNYYFVLTNGAVSVFHSSVRFQGYFDNYYAIFSSGVYNITLELCHKDGKSYVKIYE